MWYTAIRYPFIANIAPARPFRWSADAAEMGASQTKQHFTISILEKRASIKLRKTWNENAFKIQLEVGRVSFLL